MTEMSFGDWLKHQRLGLGLTQDQLALQINCSTSALRKFETEERRPSAETVKQLADIFNIPPEERGSFLRFARGDWQASAGGEPDNAPWRLSNIDQQSNLPSLITSFIGRGKEQRELISLLKKNRLVTLAGAGGMGKTRLAIQVGHQQLHAYPEGVWFIPLDSLSDPLRLPQTVASVFGIQEGHDRQIMEILIHVLREKTLLLILDNCEHLLETCTTLVRTLLTRCPNLRILATSREILKVEGEATYYLNSLSTPKQSDSLEKISEYDSIKLFVDRAALALSTFQITQENAQAIGEICRRLDGIPLAIELIVARVNMMTVEEISKQLYRSFSILDNNNQATLSRHKTLRASIDWSWSLLTDAEQAFLMQLSVFTGGWTLDSAQVMCDGNAMDLTGSLAQKSLIVVEQGLEHGTRYHFHEFLRQYVHGKLIQSGELEIVSDRHLQYFLGFSEKMELGLRGIEQERWYARAMDEHDNLISALEQAAIKDIEGGLYLSSRLLDVWERYDIRLGSFWLAEFLQHPESENYPVARAKALCAQGWIFLYLEKFPQARGPAEESLALFRACNDRTGEIDALGLLGTTSFYIGNRVEGNDFYQQALGLSQSLGDIWRQAFVNYLVADDHRDFQRSFDHYDRAVKLFGEAGDRRFQADVLCIIGNYRALNGEIDLAQKYLDEASRLIPFERNIDIWGDLQVVKSIIALLHGDQEEACTLLQEALVQFEKLGNQIQCLWITARLGYIALAKNNVKEAHEILVRSTQAFHTNKDNIGVVYSLEGMAGLFVITGNLNIAARLIGWADAKRKEVTELRPGVEQADVDKVVAACISRLGEAIFKGEYDKGQLMTLDEAVELALNEQ
ncbi:MAG: helix-turn-helix domain-containing protein [Anaerolineales bacterium]|jgi:non-specific serine/threonine protein kinase